MSTQDGRAWATLISNDDYLPGAYDLKSKCSWFAAAALVLHRTLISVSRLPLFVLTMGTLSKQCLDILHTARIRTIEVEPLAPPSGKHPGLDAAHEQYKDVWTKLRVFGLTDFARIALIDSDMSFLRSMDEIFDIPLPGADWIAAVPACTCNPTKMADYPED